MNDQHPLYELRDELGAVPRGLPLVAALKGFADAGNVVDQLIATFGDHLEMRTIAEFDADALLDYRSRRPIVYFDGDHLADVDYPSFELSLATDELGAPFLFLHGFEPDFRWKQLLREILSLVDDLDVRSVTWVHSIPMPVPHTRPTGSSVSGNRGDLIDELSIWKPKTNMPSSFLHLLEYELIQAGHQVAGFVMLTPHYLAETEYPPAAVAAVERLSLATGLSLPTDELRDEGQEFLSKLGEQMGTNQELQRMVANLESRHDQYLETYRKGELGDMVDVPSADEIAAEFELFLAKHRQKDLGDRGDDGAQPGGDR